MEGPLYEPGITYVRRPYIITQLWLRFDVVIIVVMIG